MLVKLLHYFKNLKREPITVVFFIAVLGSFFYHVNFRSQHFQECDSAGTYHLMYGFPKEALLYSAYSYPDGHLFSESTANKLLNLRPSEYFVKTYLPDYTKERLVNKLTRLNVFLAARFVYIQAVSALHLPFPLQSMFAIPYSATFSPGHGLIYGLVNGASFTYEQFMSRTTLVTTTAFHLAVLLIYFTCRRLKASAFSAAFVAFLCLFAITMYGSSYDVGSRPWNLISSIVWVWYLVKVLDNPKILKKVSIFSAILVYFNYLIAFFWLAFVLAHAFKNRHESVRGFLREVWQTLKTQKIAIIFTLICGIVFFQPGQGFRGNITFQTFFSDIYFIVLNFFSWYTDSFTLNWVQFVLGSLFIMLSVWAYLKVIKSQDQQIKLASLALLMFLGLYVLASILKVVGFAPNRQMVFVIAAIYPGIALGLDLVFTKLKLTAKNFVLLPLLLAVIVFGFWGLKLRRIDALDRTAKIVLESDVQKVFVQDCSFNLVNKNWHTNTPVEFINLENLSVGPTYLYLSQTTSFEKALEMWRVSHNIEVEVISVHKDVNLTYFIAYNPDPVRFPFSRPNSLYEVKFKVLKLEKK